ncbi:MAG TPA: NAD(P)-dependent oxidoreductase [Solirubrobacteraceae bacterium]|nr:NAD(P)-dependent oxidoreductase [Solirubrobacteraceae bacterium]
MLPRPVNASVIFGGSGFIGRHVTHELVRQGGTVVLADVVEPAWTLPARTTFVRRDVRRPIEPIDEASPDLVVNLAAVHRTPGHPDHEYYEANEGGARHVADYCRAAGAARVWFTSSIAVYGPTEEPKDEHSPLEPVSAYGKSKLRAEEIHREWAREAPGRRLVIVRPATVFGPGEGGNFARLARSLRTRTFVYPGRRDARKACGYVEDLVASMTFMERFAEPEITYNFAYPQPPTTEEIVETFVRVAGYSRPVGTIPLRPLLGVARGLNAVGLKAFDPQRVVKLVNSTNIVARELPERGYAYRTDLQSALERWYREDPAGTFV